jgi:spore maturation protein CgeB
MKILCVFGQYAYGDPARGEGYEYVNFLPALRRLGHEVVFFESLDRKLYGDFAELNRSLLQRVEETAPDVVLCVLMQYEVWIETIRLIRDSGPVLINWATDDSWKYTMFSRLLGPEFDLYATTYSDVVSLYHRDGIGSVYLSQWAANAEALVPPIPARECRYPVSFVGAAYGNRSVMVEALRREAVEVACFGHGWPAGPVEAKGISEIVRSSQVCLNFSEGSRRGGLVGMDRQIKARIFEVPGYGGCLLSERAPNLDRYFRIGEEILTFEGSGELVGAVKTLLANPERRDTIAQCGFERVSREHTYDRRFEHLFTEMNQRVSPRPRRSVNWHEFEAVENRHSFGPGLRAFRAILVRCARLIWGERRGPRAVRRVIFELSWRLVGARTYAAAGWPGRIFYKES